MSPADWLGFLWTNSAIGSKLEYIIRENLLDVWLKVWEASGSSVRLLRRTKWIGLKEISLFFFGGGMFSGVYREKYVKMVGY